MARTIKSWEALPLLFQHRGMLSVVEIRQEFGVSQATAFKWLKKLEGQIIRLGAGRNTRYALRRAVRNWGSEWIISRMTDLGWISTGAQLQAVYGGFVLEFPEAEPPWLKGNYPGGFFSSLPFFLQDLRPQGFTGRALARQMMKGISNVPSDLSRWNDDDILEFLLTFGGNLPGDLMLSGKQARTHPAFEIINESARPNFYLAEAERVLSGEVAGSSAGGEQPKFFAKIRGESGVVREVLVKFSPPRDTAAGERWADLLAAEEQALRILRDAGLNAAEARVVDAGTRRFLEVTRFDRTQLGGRRGVLSLEALLAGLCERSATTWLEAANALQTEGLINQDEAATLRRLWCFGNFIGNTDMHQGNLAFWFGFDLPRPFRLAPVYDMLPMGLAPTAQGELIEREFTLPAPLSVGIKEWRDPWQWAIGFWESVQADGRISNRFKGQAAKVCHALKALGQAG